MVNDYFKGLEMSAHSADKFTVEHISKDLITEDLALMDAKYWDYKLWHPAVATMYFVARYHDIAAKVLRREVGEDEAKAMEKRAKYYDLAKQDANVITGFWTARQNADAIGCTYDVYIRAAIGNFRANWHKQASTKRNRRQYLPYPTQMYNPMIREQAILAWSQDKEARFPMPKHEDIPNNTMLWFRPEMEAWLREEAGKRASGNMHIQRAIDAGIILNHD